MSDDYLIRVTTTFIAKVRPRSGGEWVALPGQEAGQTYGEAQDIVKRKVGAKEEAAIFEHFESRRRVNAERR